MARLLACLVGSLLGLSGVVWLGMSSAADAAATSELTEAEYKEATNLYFDRCSGCHGMLRKGATGPDITAAKMLEQSIADLHETIFEGTDTGMPGWGRTGELNEQETDLLARFLQATEPAPPEWSLSDIRDSHQLITSVDARPATIQHDRDPGNQFGVILRDAGKGAIIDGDTKEMINVVETGYAVHIFRASATGRYFYTIGRDGVVNMIDMFMEKPEVVATVRACMDARSVDVSKYEGFEDRYAVVGCYWPPQIVVLDGPTLEPIKVISTRSNTYDTGEYHPEPRVATIVASHHKPEWVIAIKETGLVWLLDYSDLKNLKITQIETERFLHDGGFDRTGRYLLIAANARNQMVVVDVKEGEFVTKFETGVKPHPGRGANWRDPEYGWVNATTHLGEGKIAVYGADPESEYAWQVVREAETNGPGLFLKTHPNSNHVWTDATLALDEGMNQTVCVFKIDDFDAGCTTLQVSDYGKVVHFEYNEAGDEVWVSVWDDKGKLVIYDDKTLEVKDVIEGDWLVSPTGKWNVHNTVEDIY
jgi:nitrite reductase (NO-forming) / hydroxylamine reductase